MRSAASSVASRITCKSKRRRRPLGYQASTGFPPPPVPVAPAEPVMPAVPVMPAEPVMPLVPEAPPVV